MMIGFRNNTAEAGNVKNVEFEKNIHRNDQHDDNECSCATVFASLLCLFSSEHDTAMMQ